MYFFFFFAFYVNIDSDETFTARKKKKEKEKQGAAEEENKRQTLYSLLAFHVRTVALSAPFKPSPKTGVKTEGDKT